MHIPTSHGLGGLIGLKELKNLDGTLGSNLGEEENTNICRGKKTISSDANELQVGSSVGKLGNTDGVLQRSASSKSQSQTCTEN